MPRGLQSSMWPVRIRHAGDKTMSITESKLNLEVNTGQEHDVVEYKKERKVRQEGSVTEHPRLLCTPTKIEIEIKKKAAPIEGCPTPDSQRFSSSFVQTVRKKGAGKGNFQMDTSRLVISYTPSIVLTSVNPTKPLPPSRTHGNIWKQPRRLEMEETDSSKDDL